MDRVGHNGNVGQFSAEPVGGTGRVGVGQISSLSPSRAGPAGTAAAAGNARVHLDGAVANRVLPD